MQPIALMSNQYYE